MESDEDNRMGSMSVGSVYSRVNSLKKVRQNERPFWAIASNVLFISMALKEITSQTDSNLLSLSLKPYVFEDK